MKMVVMMMVMMMAVMMMIDGNNKDDDTNKKDCYDDFNDTYRYNSLDEQSTHLHVTKCGGNKCCNNTSVRYLM